MSHDGRRFGLKDACVVFDGSATKLSTSLPLQTSRGTATSRDRSESWVAEVKFDYLPEHSPEQEGWELVMDQGNVRPIFSVAADAPEPNKCLCVEGTGYRLDYREGLADKRIESVHCAAALRDADLSTVYAHVQLRSKAQQPSAKVWLAHRRGARGIAKLDSGEWTVKDPGTVVRANWHSYEWSLPEEVDRTFGTDGPWIYEKLVGIRLRGPLSLTPIRFK